MQPTIARAMQRLGWSPEIGIEDGLRRTVEWFASRPDDIAAALSAIRGGQHDGVVTAASCRVGATVAAAS